MTIRGGGSPREDRSQAHPLEPGSFDEAPWPDSDARRALRPANDRRDPWNGRNGGRGGGIWGFLRFMAFALVLAAIVLVVGLTALRPVVTGTVTDWAYDNPSALRIPFVADMVRERLGTALTDPASSDPADVEFKVLKDDTIDAVAARLAEAGLVSDPRAFIFQATLRNLTPQLKEGNFRLAKSMTADGLVTGLIENRIVVTTLPVTFREGLRLEQITAKLQTLGPPVTLDPQQFYELVEDPPATLLADYPWLAGAGLPQGASLEGFLAPATYTVTAKTTAEDLVRQMLNAFHEQVGDERMAVPKSRGMTFYQVLALASLVEREAKLDVERPIIAGVFQNRIDRKPGVQHGLLQADPTVLYAYDTTQLGEYSNDWQQYLFWDPKRIPDGSYKDLPLPERLVAYNTYARRGLPPGPICTPSVASVDAALAPNTKTGYLFFVAIPDGTGMHAFAKTQAEHEANLRKYGYA